ncbi:helix-turn-helix domain-containing protein [Leptospira ellisii]|uniref:AraC family transcriptional regulator n=1 Tax=Leptospira ellisii TaxID=2023197 RepID=A0A2N0BLU3_9LEPT|nr:helix-turn-helix domain-containing protein [Leptospira ellisii]MDV6236007.1 helix-turn-helix domain-containing protein [Leptospira ellisii]PJZ94282.1 AraC family transcriptional regulator [Leptospira ellisii]PKA04985.1 AraC family transcriptional regulator [Leptospira ellisii]
MVNTIDWLLREDLLIEISRFGAFFALIIGAGRLLKARKQIDYFVAGLLTLTAVFQYLDENTINAVSYNWMKRFLFQIDLLALSTSGILVYLISIMVFSGHSKLPSKHYWNLVPPVVLSIPIASLYDQQSRFEFGLFLYLTDIFVIAYVGVALYRMFQHGVFDFRTVKSRVLAGLVLTVSVCSFLEILGIVMEQKLLVLYSGVFTTLEIVYFYFVTVYFQDFLAEQVPVSEVQKNVIKKSLLNDVDIEALEKQLTYLISEERIYLDEDIRLPSVAEELGVTVHQLSSYLNDHKGINFNNYINQFRVEEAKAILINDPSRSVISVGNAVGFNSNSVFHRAFLRETGMSPKKFREAQLFKKPSYTLN